MYALESIYCTVFISVLYWAIYSQYGGTKVYLLYHLEIPLYTQGQIQDFLKGGSESGVDIEGGANPSIVSLKQGVRGAQPPRSYGVFNFG